MSIIITRWSCSSSHNIIRVLRTPYILRTYYRVHHIKVRRTERRGDAISNCPQLIALARSCPSILSFPFPSSPPTWQPNFGRCHIRCHTRRLPNKPFLSHPLSPPFKSHDATPPVRFGSPASCTTFALPTQSDTPVAPTPLVSPLFHSLTLSVVSHLPARMAAASSNHRQ